MDRSWDVLLLGGSSAAGKSTAGREIERRLDVSWFDGDSLFISLLAATAPEQLPDVHQFGNHDAIVAAPVESLFPRFLAACELVSRSISMVARHHGASDHHAAIEATWLTPRMADACLKMDPQHMRAVFVCDNSTANITRSMRARWASQPARRPPLEARQRLVQLAHEHSLWIEAECDRLRLPVVRARPRETLVDRILAAAEG